MGKDTIVIMPSGDVWIVQSNRDRVRWGTYESHDKARRAAQIFVRDYPGMLEQEIEDIY